MSSLELSFFSSFLDQLNVLVPSWALTVTYTLSFCQSQSLLSVALLGQKVGSSCSYQKLEDFVYSQVHTELSLCFKKLL